MDKFQLGKFDIDVKRCRISAQDYAVVVEPKVMEVLQYLYRHAGEVVSQEQLFNAVWPGSIFNTSSVQRCIALLRKALNENSRNASIVVTHPKRGYSLEPPPQPDEKDPQRQYIYALLLTCLLVLGIGMWSAIEPTQVKMDYSRLLPLSSSGANETFHALSPDGLYLAFVRDGETGNNIWIRALQSGKEEKLTEQASHYTSLGWKPDSSALAFIEYADNKQTMAYVAIDMLTAVRKTVITDFPLYHVSSGKLQWHSENRIYFIETDKRNNDTWLSFVDVLSATKQQLLKATGQDWLKTLALSPDEQNMLLGYEMGQNRYRVDMVDISNLRATPLVEIDDSIYGLSWHPSGKSALISNRTKLQVVNMQGELSEIAFNNYKYILDAQFDSTGQEIFMELRNVDVDILRKTTRAPDNFETLVDTSSLDFLPVFSPDDSRFVFESHRAGLKQLFIYEQGRQRLIFSNPDNEELFGVVWTPDGKKVIAASSDNLFFVDVATGSFTQVAHGQAPFGLREHFKNDNAVLVTYRADDGMTFYVAKLDLHSLRLTTYETEGERLVCYSAALSPQDQVYFANSKQVFRINQRGQKESVWMAHDQSISGIHIANNALSMKLDKGDTFTLLSVDLTSGESKTLLQGAETTEMLINTSNDEQQFLYLSKPVKTGELVRLH